MTDRLGVQANVAVPGTLSATIVVAALLVPAYEEWARQAADAAQAAVDDALFAVASAPLRVLAVEAEGDRERPDVLLTLQSRAGSSAQLDEAIVELHAESERRPAHWIGAEAIRDRDASILRHVANEDDVLRARLDAGDPFSEGRTVALWIWFAEGTPLVVELYAPTLWTQLTELEWREVP